MSSRRSRTELWIDLTALLDVILILLFWLVIQLNQQQAAETAVAKQAQAEAAARVQRLQTELEAARSAAHLDDTSAAAWSAFSTQSDVLTVSLPETDTAPMTVTLNGDRHQQAADLPALKTAVQTLLKAADQPVVVMVLTYDNRRVLWRTYRQVSDLLTAVRADHQGVILYQERDRIAVGQSGLNGDKTTVLVPKHTTTPPTAGTVGGPTGVTAAVSGADVASAPSATSSAIPKQR